MTCDLRERESFARIPTTSTRRLFLAAGSAAAVFGTLTAEAAQGAHKIVETPQVVTATADPVLVALDRFKAARDALHAVCDPYDDDAIDAAADRVCEARQVLLTTRPTTVAGAVQLARYTANQVEQRDPALGQSIDALCAFLVNLSREG